MHTYDTLADYETHLDEIKNTQLHLDLHTAKLAFLAHRDHAGNLTGSPDPIDYLTNRLGITRTHARTLIRRGKALYATAKNQYTTHTHHLVATGELSIPQLDAVTTAHEKYIKAGHRPSPKVLNAMAIAVKDRSMGDTKKYLHDHLTRLNPPELTKRPHPTAYFSDPDRFGMVTFTATHTQEVMSIFQGTLMELDKQRREKSRHTGTTNLSPQIILGRVFGDFLTTTSDQKVKQPGLVISVTAKELIDGRPEFFTNTGHTLTLEQAREIINEEHLWVATHHPITGHVLHLGKTRIADFWIRVALFAEQGTCAMDGCNVPAALCQVHHVVPVKHGGATDIDNCVLLCAKHHGMNDDDRTSDHRGFFTKDRTGPVFNFQGNKTVNHSTLAQKAAGYKIRHE